MHTRQDILYCNDGADVVETPTNYFVGYEIVINCARALKVIVILIHSNTQRVTGIIIYA